MKCSFCSGQSYITLPYMKKNFCKNHFEKMVKKRFRSNIKNLGMLRKGDKIVLKDDTSPENIFLKLMLEQMPYKFSKRGKKILPDFLDQLSEEFLMGIFSGEWKDIDLNKKVARPLFNFRFREIEKYLEMKGKKVSKPFQTHDFLKGVVEARPGAMFSLSKWWHDKYI